MLEMCRKREKWEERPEDMNKENRSTGCVGIRGQREAWMGRR